MKYKFEQLYETIKADIQDLTPGQQLPRFREMMQTYGAAQITLQKVFDMLQNEGLVIRQAGKGIFKSDGTASNEPAPATRKILLILPMHPSPFFDSFSNCFLKTAKELDDQPLISRYNTDEPVGRWIHGNLKFDAVIALLPGMQIKTETLAELGRLDCPVVVIDRHLNGLEIHSVSTDNIAGGTLAASHFIATGKTRTAILLAEPEVSSVIDRAESFKRQMILQGYPEPLVINTHTTAGEFSVQKACTGLQEYLKEHGLTFDGLFCVSDPVALGALKALHNANISIPDQLSVIGYDDMDFAEYFHPALTTIRQDLQEISNTAFKVIHNVLDTAPDRSYHKQVMPKLILRESTMNIS